MRLCQDFLTDLKGQITQTGSWWCEWSSKWEEPLFSHLVLTSPQYNWIKTQELSLKTIAQILEVDFISVAETGDLYFRHITSPFLAETIETEGLRASSTSIGDLGAGIYVVPTDSIEGMENLKDYVLDQSEESLLMVEGHYEGDYLRCLWGQGHEDYYVLQTPHLLPEGLCLEEIEVDDFFNL